MPQPMSMRLSVWCVRPVARSAMLILAGFFLIALPGSSESAKPESERGSWHAAPPIPTKRTEVAAAAVDGKIYVVGGFEKPSVGNVMNFGITPSVEMYDPVTDRWASTAPMPVGLHHVGIGVAGGRLYVIGGYRKSGLSVWNPVATVYAYDPATDRWTENASMPTARGALSVAEHEGKLYAIGGYDRKANNAQVEVYDPILNTWTTRASLPTPRCESRISRPRAAVSLLLLPAGRSTYSAAKEPPAHSATTKFMIQCVILGNVWRRCRQPVTVSDRR